MSKFQKSNLTTENQCKQCANCCKSLAIWVQDTEGMSDRIGFLGSSIISCKRTGIFVNSIEWLILVIDSRCKHLVENSSGYGCTIWESKEKPNLCRSYPSNQFYNFTTNTPFTNEIYINKTISIVSDICPALSNINIDDVKKDQKLLSNIEIEERSDGQP